MEYIFRWARALKGCLRWACECLPSCMGLWFTQGRRMLSTYYLPSCVGAIQKTHVSAKRTHVWCSGKTWARHLRDEDVAYVMQYITSVTRDECVSEVMPWIHIARYICIEEVSYQWRRYTAQSFSCATVIPRFVQHFLSYIQRRRISS